MIQDIYPHRLNNRFDPSKRPDENSFILSFSENDLLIKGEVLPHKADLKNVSDEELVFLFTVDNDKDFFLYRDVVTPENVSEGFEYINVRTLRSKGFAEKYMAFAIYTGLHLAHWYRNNKFCRAANTMLWFGNNRVEEPGWDIDYNVYWQDGNNPQEQKLFRWRKAYLGVDFKEFQQRTGCDAHSRWEKIEEMEFEDY